LLLLLGCGKPAEQASTGHPPERIVSLAPNITDTLSDLGLEARLVGISRFSDTDSTSALPIVGDFMNINYEAVVSLQPDLVVLEKSSDDQKARLDSLDIPYLETGSLTIGEILNSIRSIGEVCKVEEQAEEMITRLERQIDTARNAPSRRPRTLLTFSDFSNHTKIEQVYAFGSACIHSELLGIAGANNVVTDSRPSVTLSREAIIRLDPELIIELSAGGPTNHWENLANVDAIKHHRIYVLDGPYTTIPSPGFLMRTLADFSRIIRESEGPP
ncbi:MAG TPA: ABC transporter substrate-binding protein, partial [Pontiella sp.]|nr:ABC transporter substrate-binding protein [Pontiella sp.]